MSIFFKREEIIRIVCEYERFKKTKKLLSGIRMNLDGANYHLVVCFIKLRNLAIQPC